MCNNNGACRKLSGGTMCPSYRVTRDERDVTRGRANSLRLAMTGQLGADALRERRPHRLAARADPLLAGHVHVVWLLAPVGLARALLKSRDCDRGCALLSQGRAATPIAAAARLSLKSTPDRCYFEAFHGEPHLP